jgi:ABC-type uncharacterized transport system substrate-binding protein
MGTRPTGGRFLDPLPLERSWHRPGSSRLRRRRRGTSPADSASGIGPSGPHNRMIQRRAFVAGMTAVMAARKSVYAQQPNRLQRIGFLAYQPCKAVLDPSGAFLHSFRELGYSEGRNIVIECREAIGQFERLAGLAQELVRLNVDVLVTEGTPQSVAGKIVKGADPASLPVEQPSKFKFIINLKTAHALLTIPPVAAAAGGSGY